MLKFSVFLLVCISATIAESDTTFQISKDNDVYSGPILRDLGGNWGDLISGKRQNGDKLVIRQIKINDKSATATTWDWKVNLSKKTITQLRFLNIGRQRAEVHSAFINGATASAKFTVPRQEQFRLLVEVYAK